MARPKRSADAAAPRFDVSTLQKLAGNKVFARGVEYHRDGQVEIVSIDRSRVLARVMGSEIYRAELKGQGKKFSGTCSCPAFSDWGFCKHLVAAALTANDLGPDAAEQAGSRLSRIREYLRSKGIEPLIDRIVSLAEDDPDLFGNLELESIAATADDGVLYDRFKKAITAATRANDYIEYGEARAWAKKINLLLDQIAGLIAGERAELALRLTEHFFARMDQALPSVDDSDGDGSAAYAKAGEIHLAACRKAKPDRVVLARELFRRETESEWGFFGGASEIYADVLGDVGLAEYRRLASEAWQNIKPARPGQRDDEQSGMRYRLGAILERFAQRDGDVDARIVIRTKRLSAAHDYLEIARLCLAHQRGPEAIKWVEEGLWQFDDDPDERLVFFAADLYRRVGRQTDAVELLWRTFERHPSIELYSKVKEAVGPQKAALDTASKRAIAFLQAKLDKPGVRARRSAPREVLLDVLMSEGMFAEAWQAVRSRGCGETRLLALANASEQSHPDEALAVYGHEVERLASLGGQRNYEAARKLITRMKSVRDTRGQTADHDAFLADFVGRHKARRNLIKILQVDAIGRSQQRVRVEP